MRQRTRNKKKPATKRNGNKRTTKKWNTNAKKEKCNTHAPNENGNGKSDNRNETNGVVNNEERPKRRRNGGSSKRGIEDVVPVPVATPVIARTATVEEATVFPPNRRNLPITKCWGWNRRRRTK